VAGSKFPGLIFCAGVTPRQMRSRHRHRFFPLEEAIAITARGIEVDEAQLAAWSRELDRSRASSSRKARRSLESEALQAWEELHKDGALGANAADMGRKIHAKLLATGWSKKELPEPKALADKLRVHHRKTFRRKRRA
jgi:hypothetical protein